MRNGLTLLGVALVVTLAAVALAEDPAKGNKYVGAEKCKTCHGAKAKGDPYSVWKTMKHSKAFETLGTDEAKKIAKDKGIADPATSDKCLKCHQTAFGVAAADLDAKFNPKNGVQCESCHGPGGNHVKARMAAAGEDEGDELAEVADTEIVKAPPAATCKTCHNEESPSFKPFCYKFAAEKIRHLDPRRKRTDAELKAMKCTGDCGVAHEK